MKSILYTCIGWLLIGFSSCSGEEPGGTPSPPPIVDIMPVLAVEATAVTEIDGGVTTEFEVKASRSDFTKDVTFEYSTRGVTAEPNVDFTATSGTATIAVGTTSTVISVDVLNDDEREIDEEFALDITNAQNATVDVSTNICTIKDNDPAHLTDDEGYNTPSSYYGYSVLFEENFESGILDDNLFNYEMGDGCAIDLCGWGNNELQRYTDDFNNIKIEDDKMVITAIKEDIQSFKSARLTTKDKLEFKFGRIDIRAKLPEGQGIWPAIWLLGANIDEVSWPACGEIDLMELVGHKPKQSVGTAHWGSIGNPSKFVSGTYNNPQKFSEGFHVFTMIWELNEMTWYVDDTKFHTINRSTVSPENYPFNQDFFFIFNVAVGGNWPGSPDDTTIFPQRMEIDYIRVFQET